MAMDLGKQVGPLPLGAWFAVVGGGLGLAYYGYKQQKPAPTPVTDTGGQVGVGDGSVPGNWLPTTPPTGVGTGDVAGPATTNEAWAVRAINWLIAQGYDATESDSAVRKYITGNDPAPSAKEYVLQGIVLAHFGSPPYPLPPPLTPPPVVVPPGGNPTPTPVPTPAPSPVPPAPARGVWAVVTAWPTRHSTLSGIAKDAYGDANQWHRIFDANRKGVKRPDGTLGMITDPNRIFAGWWLFLPQ